jgi:hypothetical protein
MSDRIALTARTVDCPTCGAARFSYCTLDGVETARSHPARAAAARLVLRLSPGQVEALHKLHVDPTRYLSPGTRTSLLKLGLIVALDPPVLPGKHHRYPKRRHPLTDSGRAAIGMGVAAEERGT